MRTRIGDGSSFSTAYSRNYVFDGAEYVPADQFVNASSLYWQKRAKSAVNLLSGEIPDNEQWEAWWAQVAEDATSRDIATLVEAELAIRHAARIESIISVKPTV